MKLFTRINYNQTNHSTQHLYCIVGLIVLLSVWGKLWIVGCTSRLSHFKARNSCLNSWSKWPINSIICCLRMFYILTHWCHCETHWSRIRRWTLRNVHILMVSAVKICKQCPQAASVPQTQTLLGDFHPQIPWAIVPKIKIPVTVSVYSASEIEICETKITQLKCVALKSHHC